MTAWFLSRETYMKFDNSVYEDVDFSNEEIDLIKVILNIDP